MVRIYGARPVYLRLWAPLKDPHRLDNYQRFRVLALGTGFRVEGLGLVFRELRARRVSTSGFVIEVRGSLAESLPRRGEWLATVFVSL